MFYQNFALLCARIGKSPSTVALELGLSKGTVTGWRNGAMPHNRQLSRIAEYFGVSVEELTGPSPDNPLGVFKVKTKQIPLLGDVSCGMPRFANEEENVLVDVNSKIQADFCLKAVGDSMIGAKIFDGDIVLCKFQPMVENGEIAVVIIEEEATLKRVHYDRPNNVLLLCPENPVYPIIKYQGEELNHIRILGKAIYRYGEIK